MHIYQIDTIYRSNRSKNSSGVIWGHRGSKGHKTHTCVYAWDPLPMLCGQIPSWSQGSKGHFHQNCSNLSILNSLTIILKHMHELETPTYVVGSKINLGSLGILQKRAGFVSFQRHTVLVLLLSGNTSFSYTSRHPILTKLGQRDRYLDHYSGTNNGGVRGHDGVTRVKKVIFTKKASSPTEYLALTGDLCICISLTPSTKVITLKIHPGSLGVTGVKRSFSPKRHQVLQNT